MEPDGWDEWLRVASVHEAGHAAVARALKVRLRHAMAELRRTWSGQSYGHGEVDPIGRLSDRDAALIHLAGPEAEARWWHRHQGGRLADWRDRVWEQQSGDPVADLDRISGLLPGSGMTMRDLERETARLVDREWRAVKGIAAELEERQYLTWSQVERAARAAR